MAEDIRGSRSVEADENSTNTLDLDMPEATVPPHLWRTRPDGWWMNRAGRWIRIVDMPDQYLENLIRFLRRRNRETQIIDELIGEQSQRQIRRAQEAAQQRYMEQAREEAANWGRAWGRIGRSGVTRVPINYPIQSTIPPEPEPEPEVPLPDRPRRIKE